MVGIFLMKFCQCVPGMAVIVPSAGTPDISRTDVIIITTGRWYAQAPLGPTTCRAYRLIEFSFACVFCPTTANAVISAPKAPLCKG